jgi:hypothetical protein
MLLWSFPAPKARGVCPAILVPRPPGPPVSESLGSLLSLNVISWTHPRLAIKNVWNDLRICILNKLSPLLGGTDPPCREDQAL